MIRPSTRRTLAITTRTVALGTVLVLAGSQELPWTSQAEAVPSAGHRHSHNHPHDGLTWPPQPRGMGNAILHSNVAEENHGQARKQARLDRLEYKAKGDVRAIHGWGNRYTHVAVIDQDDEKDDRDVKGQPTVVNRLVSFSHEKNVTVEVGFDRKSTRLNFSHEKNVTVEVGFDADERIVSVSTTPAKDYQPEITDEEVKEAEQLARKHLTRGKSKRVAGLQAFGILAYKPEGTGFYDTRVIYISFHKDNDSPPELMAWVDLTNQRVLQVREEL